MLRRTKKPNAQVSDLLLGLAMCGTVQPQRHPWFPASPSSFVARARCLYTPPGSIISCAAPRWRSAPSLSLPHRSYPWFTRFFMRPAGAAPDGPCRRGHLQGWQTTCAAPLRAGPRFKAHRSQIQVSARDETLLRTHMLAAAAAEAWCSLGVGGGSSHPAMCRANLHIIMEIWEKVHRIHTLRHMASVHRYLGYLGNGVTLLPTNAQPELSYLILGARSSQ